MPREDFHLRAVCHHRRRRVDDRRARVVFVIDRDQRAFFVAEDARERTVGRGFEQRVHLLDRRRAVHLEDAISERRILHAGVK